MASSRQVYPDGAARLLIDAPPMHAIEPIMAVMIDAFDPAYGEAWNRQQVLGMLVSPLCHSIVALDHGDCPLGFALTRRVTDEEELLLIATVTDGQRTGIASTMLRQVIDNAMEAGVSSIFLEMRSNNPARLFYDKFGFTLIGKRRKYYTGIDGARYDALTLQKSFDIDYD
ncbi:MAG: GNAT family N-acetyltransferase [Blastomonas sp.]